MNLVTLASHTVDLDLLPEVPLVLDAGCRWFDFHDAVLDRRPNARGLTIDPARDVQDLSGPLFGFMRAALVANGNALQQLAHFSTGEGDFLTQQSSFPGWDKQPELYTVECYTIDELMLMEGIKHFDLVKLDIEGSEFEVLEAWPGPIATQISVEFHDWNRPTYRSESYYDALMKKLPWYEFVKHDLSKQGEGVGHWDSLLVLR
jgi:hypothetical protein